MGSLAVDLFAFRLTNHNQYTSIGAQTLKPQPWMHFFRTSQERPVMQTPMGPNIESPVRSPSPTSRCTDSGLNLERTAMVSSSTVTLLI